MVLPLLQKRRSIRKFQNRPVEQEKIDALVEAALRSPSSRRRDPWEFVFVDDPELLRQLGATKEHGSGFIADAPLAVAVAADPRKCDVWIEDCSIASILLQLTAQSLGLGSCWVQVRLRSDADGSSSEDYVKEILQLPDQYVVESLIAIGYPAEAPAGHPRESLDYAKIHLNRYAGS